MLRLSHVTQAKGVVPAVRLHSVMTSRNEELIYPDDGPMDGEGSGKGRRIWEVFLIFWNRFVD